MGIINVADATKILVLGGTGHFGGRICRRLVGEPNTRLVVTSRSQAAAENLAIKLRTIDSSYPIDAAAIDQEASTFEADLAALSPNIVIHTAGPYQGRNYRVAEACIRIGCHYIDLADGRQFVQQFRQLDERARQADVLLVSGASTLPGLSSVVIEAFRNEFNSIDTVEMSIAPAHQTPRGYATIAAVLSYCGTPIEVLEDGEWVTRYGWQDLRKHAYPALGTRLSAACDVPDLAIVPEYLPGVRTVRFHAALEARWEQLALWCMSGLVRAKLVSSWNSMLPLFHFLSEKLIRLGSQKGGMHVRLAGNDVHGAPKVIN